MMFMILMVLMMLAIAGVIDVPATALAVCDSESIHPPSGRSGSWGLATNRDPQLPVERRTMLPSGSTAPLPRGIIHGASPRGKEVLTMLQRVQKVTKADARPKRKESRFARLELQVLEDRTVPSGVKVMLDPGHGGRDPGAISVETRTRESDMNLDMAFRVERFLVADGNTVQLTRRDDRYISLSERPRMAQAWGADLFISIHFNSAQPSSRGSIGFVYGSNNVNAADDVVLGSSLARWTASSFSQGADRGARYANYAVLNDYYLGNTAQTHPTVASLLEVEFISNRDVDRFFNNANPTVREQNRDRVARNIARGIEEAAGQLFRNRDTTNPTISSAALDAYSVRQGRDVVLNWSANDNVGVHHIGLYVYRNGQAVDMRPYGGTADGAPTPAAVNLSNGGSYRFTVPNNFPVGDGLQIKVVAWDAAGNRTSAFTPAFSVIANTRPVQAPSWLNAMAISPTQANLSWGGAAEQDGFRIYQWGANGLTLVATVGPNSNQFTVSGLNSGQSYWFMVQSFNSISTGDSLWQGITTPVMNVAAPAWIGAQGISDSVIQVQWANVDGEEGYRVWMFDNGQLMLVAVVGANTTSYSVGGLMANQTYFFQAEAFNAQSNAFSFWTSAMTQSAVGVFNDNFANRQQLFGTSFTQTGSNVNATRESGEPIHHAGIFSDRSVWFTWTAPQSGYVELDTISSSFDTVLAAYRGTALDALSLIDSNDDTFGLGTASKLRFWVNAGDTIQIALEGYWGQSGNYVLNLKYT
jgi:N-acetylmuramoyl-L-alanine amidase